MNWDVRLVSKQRTKDYDRCYEKGLKYVFFPGDGAGEADWLEGISESVEEHVLANGMCDLVDHGRAPMFGVNEQGGNLETFNDLLCYMPSYDVSRAIEGKNGCFDVDMLREKLGFKKSRAGDNAGLVDREILKFFPDKKFVFLTRAPSRTPRLSRRQSAKIGAGTRSTSKACSELRLASWTSAPALARA